MKAWLAQCADVPGLYADAARCADCSDSLPTVFDRNRARRFETREGAAKWCEVNQGFVPVEVELWPAKSTL